MAKEKKGKSKKRRRGVPTGFAGKIPKKGLFDPSLRRDIGNVPGLAPVR